MAATSTNKQPLLVDHILHYAVNLDTALNNGIDIAGTNTAMTVLMSGLQGQIPVQFAGKMPSVLVLRRRVTRAIATLILVAPALAVVAQARARIAVQT